MTNNELKKIREKISCPQFDDDHYGEWGILNIHQRRTIKRMLDCIIGQEEYINRQKAEIESLRETICMITKTGRFYSTVRAEAIKEFAERLKEKAFPDDSICTQMVVLVDDIDTLVKEMVGDV